MIKKNELKRQLAFWLIRIRRGAGTCIGACMFIASNALSKFRENHVRPARNISKDL